MYKKYQSDMPLLNGEEKTKRENEIVAKENEIQELRNKYFGSQGELFLQQEKLIKPIQVMKTKSKLILTKQSKTDILRTKSWK